VSCVIFLCEHSLRFSEKHAQNLNTQQNNPASWGLQMGFNWAFKGSICNTILRQILPPASLGTCTIITSYLSTQNRYYAWVWNKALAQGVQVNTVTMTKVTQWLSLKQYLYIKCEFVCLQATETCVKTELLFQLFLFLDLDIGHWLGLDAGRFTPAKEPQGPCPFQTFWRTGTSSLSQKLNHDHTVIQRVSMSFYRLGYPRLALGYEHV